MKTKKVKCINCGEITRVPISNEPWCTKCVQEENERSLREDVNGMIYSRPPKYVIPQDQWSKFGY